MNKRIVVTGAAGFLGGRTAKYLAANFPDHTIVATSRRTSRKPELSAAGCIFIPGDLCDAKFCEAVTEDAGIVVHCAALSAPFGKYPAFYQANVTATRLLLEASVKNGVRQFIFISTPGIYFNYKDRHDVREAEALPRKMVNHYARTKLMAETLVLEKNGKGIQTIALRPRAIIGAEDTVLFPRMLEAYRKKKLLIVGDGQNRCDFTCVQNVIEAIVCAIHAPETAFGEAYNITDGEAVPFWEAVAHALQALGLEPPTRRISKRLAMLAAGFMEMKATLLHPHREPPLTRYGAGILSNHFTLDISKAVSILNYQPKMKTMDGINEYIAWYKSQQ
jgi:2-alkyl-3-oxoalkanoate reductase